MIDPGTITELLDRDPFGSFRIRMSDGREYEVTNPERVVAMEDLFFIALPKKGFKLLSYQNMTSVESGAVEA